MIEDLIRPHLRTFKPYVSARSEVLEAKIYLDANELPVRNPTRVGELEINRYPDPFQLEVRRAIAKGCSVNPEMVFTGVGSDEIIDLLIRLFCEPGRDSIAILEPTYGVYGVAANINAVKTIPIELDDQFQIDVPRTIRTVGPNTKLIFLCSPNNPTGNVLNRKDIIALSKKTNAIVVVDQAYVEFAPASDDLSRQVTNNENLVVLRTFSKAWGMAGIRLGYCVANKEIISWLLRIKSPYNVNAVTSQLAVNALQSRKFLKNATTKIIGERKRLAKELATLSGVIRVYSSNANFLLVAFEDAQKTFESLRRAGIIVRRRSENRLSKCLRITVGTRKENDLLLSVMRKIS